MRTRQLLVNGRSLDLSERTDIRIYLEVVNVEEPTARANPAARAVQIPATQSNIEIFGYLRRDDVPDKYNRYSTFEAVYLVDGAVQLRGRAIPFYRGGDFELQITSQQITWAEDITGKDLRAISGLGQINFIGSRAWSPASDLPNAVIQPDTWANPDLVFFPLVSYGNYFKDGSLDSGETATEIENVEWQDIPPAFRLVPIVEQIFANQGYTLSGRFFADDQVNQLFLPYIGDDEPFWNWNTLSWAYVTHTPNRDYINRAPGVGTGNEDFTEEFSAFWRLREDTVRNDYAQSYVTATNTYFVPVTGQYEVDTEIDVSSLFKDLSGSTVGGSPPTPNYLRMAVAVVRVPVGAADLLALQVDIGEYISNSAVPGVSNSNIIAFHDFGTGYTVAPLSLGTVDTTGTTFTASASGTPGTPGAQVTGSGEVHTRIGLVPLERGDQIQVWLVSQNGKQSAGSVDYLRETVFSIDTYVLSERTQNFRSTFEINLNLPKIDQLELVKWFIFNFNLYWIVDEQTKVVYFEQYSEYFVGAEYAMDLDHVLGYNNSIQTGPVPTNAKTTFTYQEDSGDYFLDKYGITRFEYERTDDTIYADPVPAVIQPPVFAATYDRLYFTDQGSYVVIPTITDTETISQQQQDSQWTYNRGFRVLKYAGLQPGVWQYDNGVLLDYPAARFSFDESATGNWSLAWSGTKAVHWRGQVLGAGNPLLPASDNIGLYVYAYEELYDSNAESWIGIYSGVIDPATFSQLRPNVPVLINGQAFYIIEVPNGIDPAQNTPVEVKLKKL